MLDKARANKERLEAKKPRLTPLEKLHKEITKTDLVKTMTDKIGDPLTKYTDEDGNINIYKIPQNLYIVAIIYEIVSTAKAIDLGISVKHGVIYLFNSQYWEEIENEEIKRILSSIAEKLGFYSILVARTSEFKDKLFKQFMATGIEEAVMKRNGDIILINLNNGTLEIDKDTVRIRDHDRADFLTYVLDYDYQKDAIYPIFDNFLTKVLPDPESRNILQEYTGFVFSSNLKLEKALVLYGTGANGKSVFFEVITALMGRANISHKGLGDLCLRGDKGNNHRAEVDNKLINYSSEISPRGADLEIFKAYVSSEPVDARRLYSDVYTYRPTAKLIFNANKLPTETERTHGFFRRYMIIPFEVTISDKEKDTDLHSKIIDSELGGVLNWVIIGLKRLLKNRSFSECEKADEALENFKRESNSVLLFVEEYHIVEDPNGFTSNEDLYSSYTWYCSASGYSRFNQNNFSKELSKHGFEPISKKIAGHTKRGFKVEFEESAK